MAQLKKRYEEYLVNCIRNQCPGTRERIDEYRTAFATNRQSAGFSEAWKQLTFVPLSNRMEGCQIHDLDGNMYTDLTMGFGVHLFGHSPAFIKEAIEEQLKKGFSVGPIHETAGVCAQLICEMTSSERCSFFNSGTEAVMVALRLARAATRKKKVVIFEGSYHGTHDPLLVMKTDQHHHAVTTVPGIPSSLVEDTILLPFADPLSIKYIREHADAIAAVLTEPVRSRHPETVDPVFLRQLQDCCSQNEIAFILDEVITGFRISNGGAKEWFGLDPDLVIYGKVAGGGMPVGIVAGKSGFMNYIDGGAWRFDDDSAPVSPTTFVAGTFCQHPLTMAAMLATLQYLRAGKNSIQEDLNKKTAALCEHINAFCREEQIPVSTACFGSLFRFLVKGRNRLFYHALLKEGIYLWEGRNAFLSTAHHTSDIEKIERAVRTCLLEMKAAGYFPSSVKHKDRKGNYLTAAIELNEVLDKEILSFAIGYATVQLEAANGESYPTAVDFYTDRTQWILASREKTGDALRFLILTTEDKTGLIVQGQHSEFDGWSVTMLLRFIGRVYGAFEKNRKLPLPAFVPPQQMKSWRRRAKNGMHPTLPARSLHHFHATDKKLSFEFLLSCFAIALHKKNMVIGVPFSGQIFSRNLMAIGAYTSQVPVHVPYEDSGDPHALAVRLGEELDALKKKFCRHAVETEYCSIVFNVDNLVNDLRFAGRTVLLPEVDDSFTHHELVFNIMMVENGLHISVKFPQDTPDLHPRAIIEKFCSLLTPVHVPAPGR